MHGKSDFPIWHDGEVAMQKALGVDERMAQVAPRVIRDFMPDQHREFFAQLPFVVLGSVDAQGNVWATLAEGPPGFLSSPDPRQLAFDMPRNSQDPAHAGLEDGDGVGLLGIELDSRRRNRLNGHIECADAQGFILAVEHSFGNCPQYIQLRDWHFARDPEVPFVAETEEPSQLEGRAAEIVAQADTFFVASYVEREAGCRQVDASHRGGRPGFVHIGDDGALTIPDFAGNLHFNTLGNFLINPCAGLVFVDFESGDILQMTGDANVHTDVPEIADFQGAERFWTFRPRRIVLRRAAIALRWTMQDDGFSPNSLMTGSWEAAKRKGSARQAASGWQTMRVAEVKDESASVRSFTLAPAEDGATLPPHLAGQNLMLRVTPGGDDRPLVRNYTISAAPSDQYWRISVKRDGRVSNWLHDNLYAGDTLEAKGPQGGFTIDPAEKRPAVLLAAGVGITPMVAMLRSLLFEAERTRAIRPATLFQIARDKADRAFADEIDELVQQARGALRHLRIHTRPGEGEEQCRDFDLSGRPDAEIFPRFLSFGDYDFYLCGPGAFMQDMYDNLRDAGVADARIHAEAFGPSALTRKTDPDTREQAAVHVSAEPVPVLFGASGKEARWSAQSGSLLELAEERGLSPAHSCRSGSCGSCAVKLLRGKITYPKTPTAKADAGEILLCSAMPASGSGPIEVEV